MDRRLLMPAFHGARMRTYASVMAQAVRNHAGAFADGPPFALTSLTEQVSLEVILRAVFGLDGSERIGQFQSAILEYVAAIHPAIIFLPALRTRLFPPWARLLRTRARFDELMYAEIAAHRRFRHASQDVLSLLIEARYEDGTPMSDSEVHDEMITLVIAGHETTAAAVAWCIYDLLRSPNALRTALLELDALGADVTPEELSELPYLSAVCNESMRLHPVVPDVTRELRGPLELCGYQLPTGTAVGVSAVTLHRNPLLYPDPLKFMPERFLKVKPSPFEFAPFGGGARRCLGAAFAQYEMKIVLGSLLRDYEFALATSVPISHQRRNLTVGPRGGLRVAMRTRAHDKPSHLDISTDQQNSKERRDLGQR